MRTQIVQTLAALVALSASAQVPPSWKGTWSYFGQRVKASNPSPFDWSYHLDLEHNDPTLNIVGGNYPNFAGAKVIIKTVDEGIQIVFDHKLEEGGALVLPFKKGDILFEIKSISGHFITTWKTIKPDSPKFPISGDYFILGHSIDPWTFPVPKEK